MPSSWQKPTAVAVPRCLKPAYFASLLRISACFLVMAISRSASAMGTRLLPAHRNCFDVFAPSLRRPHPAAVLRPSTIAANRTSFSGRADGGNFKLCIMQFFADGCGGFMGKLSIRCCFVFNLYLIILYHNIDRFICFALYN